MVEEVVDDGAEDGGSTHRCRKRGKWLQESIRLRHTLGGEDRLLCQWCMEGRRGHWGESIHVWDQTKCQSEVCAYKCLWWWADGVQVLVI